MCSDLTSGLAGALLALTRIPDATPEVASTIVDALWQRSERQLWGRGWPDPTQPRDGARPLCGMAHGASGIAWAVAEPEWTARWCHGAAGAGAIRLRLLALSAKGLDVPWLDEVIRAELEVAVRACGAEVWQEREAWRAYGAAALGPGWTLCHGLGAPAAVLDLAATALDEPAHRVLALDAATEFLDLAGDPSEWPCGMPAADGDLGLFNGIAGTAALFADLAGLTGPGPTVLLG